MPLGSRAQPIISFGFPPQAVPAADHVDSFSPLAAAVGSTGYAGLVFLLRVIAQGKGDETDVVIPLRCGSAARRFLHSQVKACLKTWLP